MPTAAASLRLFDESPLVMGSDAISTHRRTLWLRYDRRLLEQMAQRKCALGSNPFDEPPIAKRICAGPIATTIASPTHSFCVFSEIFAEACKKRLRTGTVVWQP